MNENVTLRQLRAFLMVAHERSFTKAAARLNVTQSALTNSIKSLEGELGLRLLDRTTRFVVPTNSGTRFAAVAERILGDVGQAIDDLRADAARQQGLVVVAATATMINTLLVPALVDLSEKYPGIRVRLIEELTEGAVKRLSSGELDLAFATLERPEADVDITPILKDYFEVVCSSRHPLASSKRPLRWATFGQHGSVALSGQSGIRGLLERNSLGQHAVQNIRYEVSSVAGLARMVESNLGIAAVPGLIANAMNSSKVVRRPLQPALWRTVSLAIRRGRSPSSAASALVAALLPHLIAADQKTIVALADASTLTEKGFLLD
jgi:LysR family transcriptional regulator, carnitine catabolism transcriptional activator